MTPDMLLLILRVLIALVLYAFFVLSIVTVWRSSPQRKRFHYEVPDAILTEVREGEVTESHPLREMNMIGRAADNTIVLEDERVSAHHARLTYTGGQWLLEDLGSRNGTFVNELRLEGPLVVTYEDHIQIGAVLFQLLEEPSFEGAE